MQDMYRDLAISCRLNNPNETIVFGEGNLDTDIMLVGEALGKDEVRLGRPFVGAAGKKLDTYLDMAGIVRDNIYVTNVVKKRPLDESASYPKNRTPTAEEVERYRCYLEEEIAMINPGLIITLGSVPLKYFCGSGARITQMHGTHMYKNGRYFFFLYHPAAVLYKKDLLETYEEDILSLKHFLENIYQAT